MRPAFKVLASSVPGLFVHFHLQSIEQFIEPAEEIDNPHEFEYGFIIQS
jgi:hypothetical protein